MMNLLQQRPFETECTIEIEHTYDMLHAHVSLDDGGDLQPGDKVTVHGSAVQVPFGEALLLRRPATVAKATALRRAWVRFLANFELCELYEVSFSPGRV